MLEGFFRKLGCGCAGHKLGVHGPWKPSGRPPVGFNGIWADQCKEAAELWTTSLSWAWQLTPVIPALMRLRQENCHKFETSLGCVVGACLKTATKQARTHSRANPPVPVSFRRWWPWVSKRVYMWPQLRRAELVPRQRFKMGFLPLVFKVLGSNLSSTAFLWVGCFSLSDL